MTMLDTKTPHALKDWDRSKPPLRRLSGGEACCKLARNSEHAINDMTLFPGGPDAIGVGSKKRISQSSFVMSYLMLS